MNDLQRPLRVRIIQGEPVRVFGRTLTPVARVVSGGEHEGTVRPNQASGKGWAMASVRPLKVIEEHDGQTRTLPIPDATGDVLRKMLIISVVAAVVSMIFIIVSRVSRAND